MQPEKVYSMSVAKVYPLLVAKAQRKGRTRDEVDQVTCWLTGYTPPSSCKASWMLPSATASSLTARLP